MITKLLRRLFAQLTKPDDLLKNSRSRALKQILAKGKLR